MEERLSKEISEKFRERIVCFLYYGSNAFANRTRTKLSDFDFCLVLDEYAPADLAELRSITSKYQSLDFSLHYLQYLEEMGWKSFQHGSMGQFFMLDLASARALIGTNIFERKLLLLDKSTIKDSLKRKIIEHFWRLDHWYLSGTADEHLAMQYKKHLIRIAHNILIAQEDISYAELNATSNDEFIDNYVDDKPYFSHVTKEYFKALKSDEPDFAIYLTLREAIYSDFRKLLHV